MNLTNTLYKSPWKFSLHQFIFLIDQIYHKNNIKYKFKGIVDMSASHSDIHSIVKTNNMYEISINSISLLGIQGALPIHYINMAIDRKREKDHALEDFLNVFNHKIIKNTYLMKRKSSFCFSNTNLYNTNLGKIINSIGIGKLNNKYQITKNASTLFPIMFWSQRTPQKLKCMLEMFLKNAKVSCNQFIGKWIKISQSDCSTLKSDCSMPNLGRKFLGKKFWHTTYGIKIIIQTTSQELYNRLLPKQIMRKDLELLINSYIPFNLHFSIYVNLNYDVKPKLELGNKSILAYSTWLNKGSNKCDL